MTRNRYTIDFLATGQPHAYADTETHVRVTFEHNWNGHGWVPSADLEERFVRDRLIGLNCGFTEYTWDGKDQSIDVYFRTRLDWIKETAPGVWEFHTTSPYTD